MNSIVDEHKLDRQQERAIYELTLKKQRSKKSTVSHKQAAAMQQLANELLAQRKTSLEMLDSNQNRHEPATDLSMNRRYPPFRTTICRCHSVSALTDGPGGPAPPTGPPMGLSIGGDEGRRGADEEEEEQQQQQQQQQQDESAPNADESPGNDRTLTESLSDLSAKTASTLTGPRVASKQHNHHHHQHYKTAKELQRQSSISTIATTSTSNSVSSSASNSSQSSSSSRNHHHHHHHRRRHHHHHHQHKHYNQNQRPCQIISTASFISSNSSTSISDETSIKLSQLRLEQLNNELERRLHQYEYLVAQEKAILGTYNMNLFTNESVNNFHLFTRLDQKNVH